MKTRGTVTISVTNDLPENVAPDQRDEWGARARSWRPLSVTETLELQLYGEPVKWAYRIRIDGRALTSKGNLHATQRDHSAVYEIPEWLAPYLRGQATLRSDLDLLIALGDGA